MSHEGQLGANMQVDDETSINWGPLDAWSGGLLACLDAQHHVVLSCVHAPWTWGFCVFCTLFYLPNVG